jgi:NAD+ synthase (glutamine-hydrolysing)
MKIALAQLDSTVGDFAGNLAKMKQAHARAGSEQAELCVFSELAFCGYPPRDLLHHADFITKNTRALEELAAATRSGPAILVGFVEARQGEGAPLYNSAALYAKGKRVGVHRKALLPTYDVFDEDRYFEPAREVHPIEWEGQRLGVTICEDVWNDSGFWPRRRYGFDPVESLAKQGAEILINLSASPYTIGKIELRMRMMARSAARHGLPLVCVNAIGGNDELIFDGSSFVVDKEGALQLALPSFEEGFAVWDSDAPAQTAARPSERTLGLDERAAQAHPALVLGLRDYVYKCGFETVLLGLSGGIDSALTAALAVEALGADKVAGFALPSRYSSDHSRSDAEDLAQRLGIEFHELSIEQPYASCLGVLEPLFRGLPMDVAEENIQARIRGVLLMALSNKRGSLLLTTGNKSELAVGYCTLYGDMSGGLAVLSDVPKTLVYALSRHINRSQEIIPQSTLDKSPSAELRPDQWDTDSLPEYEILDRILELYVEERAPVDQILAEGFDAEVVQDLIRLIQRNEYKRRQAAPGLKITSKAFGLGRRYPIAARYP